MWQIWGLRVEKRVTRGEKEPAGEKVRNREQGSKVLKVFGKIWRNNCLDQE